jgi:hypothetical protein
MQFYRQLNELMGIQIRAVAKSHQLVRIGPRTLHVHSDSLHLDYSSLIGIQVEIIG